MIVCQHCYGMSTSIYFSIIFIYFYFLTVDDGMSTLSWYVDIYLFSWFTHVYIVFIYIYLLTEDNLMYMNIISMLT